MAWQAELPFLHSEPAPAGGESPHTIALHDRIVPYVLRRSRRRTIGLSIDQRGLRVGAPYRAALSDVESLIRRHGTWVTGKLDQWREQRRPTATILAHGARFPLLGQEAELQISPGSNTATWHDTDVCPILCLHLRRSDSAARVLEQALRTFARQHFAGRVTYFTQQMQLPEPPLTLSAARTRWGSCSLKSGLRLNWRLIHFPPAVVDYVVIHELAHLREMNHSPRFWTVVAEHCPDYRARRSELKDAGARLPHWV